MNATVYCFVNAMESEASAIARGLCRRDPELLDRLIEQYQHRLLPFRDPERDRCKVPRQTEGPFE
jgi:hypothetical protein